MPTPDAPPGASASEGAGPARDEVGRGPATTDVGSGTRIEGLRGLRVLVPRGGPWGEDVAGRLRRLGAEPVVVPLIAFAPPEDTAPLDAAIANVRLGRFDWLVVTSATTVDALVRRRAVLPPTTHVAAVGAATRAACERAGLVVDLVPSTDHSARGLADELPGDAGRVLLPQSDLADPGLARALAARGAEVTTVIAYRTVAAVVDEAVRADVAAGRIGAILVTSGSVARQVAGQLAPLPPGTLVACLGPNTATEAAAAGLRVDVIAPDRSIPSLLAALGAHVAAAR